MLRYVQSRIKNRTPKKKK